MWPKATEEKIGSQRRKMGIVSVFRAQNAQKSKENPEAKLYKFSPGRLHVPAPQKEEKQDSKKWIWGFPQVGNEIGQKKTIGNVNAQIYNQRNS